MKRKITTGALSALLACACALPALAVGPQQTAGKGSPRTDATSANMTIDANQQDMFVTNFGVFAYDANNARGKADGLYFPNSYPLSDKTVIYDAGLWFGGVRGGETLVTVAEYSQEFSPGRLDSNPARSESRVYKIYKNHLDKVAAGYLVRNPDNHEDMVPLSADDYNNWPVNDPAHPDSAWSQGAPLGLDGTPWINELGADQMTFTVFNDGIAGDHSNDAGSTDPIGLEVRQTTFAFNRSDALGNVVFMKYQIIYDPASVGMPADTLHSAYLSLWADPDLGGAGDDLVGCNPDIGLGYCYNATNQDKAYGNAPPAVGFDFFKGPRNTYGVEWPPSSGDVPEFLPMTSFNKYINGTDPHSYAQSYNYMRGLNSDGTPLANGTTFQVPGDPVTGTGELDTDPADRRYMMSAGPFFMAPGDTVEVVAAVLVAQGTNRLGSITLLRFVDTFAQSAFEADFVVPQPPADPAISVSEMDRKVTLTWDGAAQDTPGSYPFQGYNVYQGRTAAGPFQRIAVYDLVDGVATIFEDVIDPETGEVYSQPVQFGEDAGVLRHIEITADAFTWAGNPNLVNNHPYYFGVSAYSYDPSETPNNLESALSLPGGTVVVATPNGGAPGSNWATVAVPDTAAHTAGGSDGLVLLDSIDEAALLGHNYTVSYYDTTWTTPRFAFYDEDGDGNIFVDSMETDIAEIWWRVTDVNTAQVKARGSYQNTGNARQYYFDTTGDGIVDIYGLVNPGGVPDAMFTDVYPAFDAYPMSYPLGVPEVDGVLVTPMGPPLVGAATSWVADDGAALRWLDGINWGGTLMNGGLDLGLLFRGSNIPAAEQKKVELVLTPNTAEWSDCAYFDRTGFAYLGIGTFPGYAQDVEDPAAPRRLNITIMERDSEIPSDLIWNPRLAGGAGREYVFVNDSDYNGGVDYSFENNGYNTDVLWGWWPTLRDGRIDTDGACTDPTSAACFDQMLAARPGRFIWTPNYVNAPGDVFSYSTTGVSHTTGGGVLSQVRAVPNPYYGHSAYETKSDVKVVKFTNLPDVATIKLFNIAGDHVRTLSKTANTSHETTWDLKNEYGVYVASGVYVYYVEAQGFGDTFGKLAVMLEEERLKEY